MLHHLTLGRNKPDGGYVTDLDWQMYCQEVLDSNFDGYTITDAVGTWKSDLEDTKIVIINTTNQEKVEMSLGTTRICSTKKQLVTTQHHQWSLSNGIHRRLDLPRMWAS